LPTITQELRLFGRQKYRGQSVIKVAPYAVDYLLPLGWSVVHRTRAYTYLRPAEGHHGRSVMLTLSIPDQETLKTVAFQCHADEKAWSGHIEGWSARYDPREERTEHTTLVRWGQSPIQEIVQYVSPAMFQVGDQLWSVGARWEEGNTEPPRWW
jgi:hypothetical protein